MLNLLKLIKPAALAALQAMGCPYVIAPADAEAYCAALTISGSAWCVLSEDSDSLANGATRLYRMSTKTLYCMSDILKDLNCTLPQFKHLCVLLGSDYNTRIAPPKMALKLMKTRPTVTASKYIALFNPAPASLIVKK